MFTTAQKLESAQADCAGGLDMEEAEGKGGQGRGGEGWEGKVGHRFRTDERPQMSRVFS